MWQWLLVAIATERAAELVTTSDVFLFRWPREQIAKLAAPMQPPKSLPAKVELRIAQFFNQLTTCGYCTSVWTAFLFAVLVPLQISGQELPLLVEGLALHGLANALHMLYELVRKGRVFAVDLAIEVRENQG